MARRSHPKHLFLGRPRFKSWVALLLLLAIVLEIKLQLPYWKISVGTPATDSANFHPPEFTQKRQNTRVWTQITFSMDYDVALIPHTMSHYLSLGLDPKFFLIGLHQASSNSTRFEELEQRMTRDYSVGRFYRWTGNYTSHDMWEARYQHRLTAGVESCDWILRSDSDELPSIPGSNALEFFKVVGDLGYDAIFGLFNDRVATNGVLPNISESPSISEQFPLACQVSQLVTRGATRKVIAFRGNMRENRGGHHLLDPNFKKTTDSGRRHCGFPSMLRIDHYKWTHPLVKKLRKRYKHYKHIKMSWGHLMESRNVLEHIRKNNGKLAVKNLKCVDSTTQGTVVNFDEVYQGGEDCGKISTCNKILS